MAILKPFRGLRPVKKKAKYIASKPYDVLDAEEAKAEAKGNKYSFYHVIKPEIDMPVGLDQYSPMVYEKGSENFKSFLNDGIFFQDTEDCLYIYQQTMNGRKQDGIVGCASVDDYLNNVIKKHELTRPDKEEDRKQHVRVGNMNAEPVFFAYPAVPALDAIVSKVIQDTPEYDFTTEDGIGHAFWVIKDKNTIQTIVDLFAKIPNTYVADGHHRTAAAALVGQERRARSKDFTGGEPFNYFLAVHFPDNQLQIFDYNRVVKDLNNNSTEEFLSRLSSAFVIEPKGTTTYRPTKLHNFGMYLEGKWYSLTAKEGTFNDQSPLGVLDVTILSEQILGPILNIHDLRTDKRIDFVGGIRGLGELEKKVNSGVMKVAFALFPVSMKQLIDIADSNNIMPPKTTWFEPKLRSGLIVHSLR